MITSFIMRELASNGPPCQVAAMNVTLTIPDTLARQIEAEGGDPGRRALEALVLEEYRAGRITKAELREALGIETRYDMDGFLKARGVYEPVTPEDIRRDLEDLQTFLRA
jgi:hypothetical protein